MSIKMGVLDPFLEPVLRASTKLSNMADEAVEAATTAASRTKGVMRGYFTEFRREAKGVSDEVEAWTVEPIMKAWEKHYHVDYMWPIATRLVIMSALVGGIVYSGSGIKTKARDLLFWGSFSAITTTPEILNPYRRIKPGRGWRGPQ